MKHCNAARRWEITSMLNMFQAVALADMALLAEIEEMLLLE